MKNHFKVYRRILGSLDWYESNEFEALTPELWAHESLRILRESLVAVPLVNRDFDDAFAQFGDVLNVNKTGQFSAIRKQEGSQITVQTATSTGSQVILNQHPHVSFYLDDHDIRRTFADLRNRYLYEGIVAIANFMDIITLGEAYQFFPYTAGQIGTDLDDQAMRDLGELFTRNLVPHNERNLMVGAGAENMLLGEERFNEARMIGDGTSIRTGELGRIRGFDVFAGSQLPEVTAVMDTVAPNGQIANVGGYDPGSTVLTVDTFTDEVTVGQWCLIEGDDIPQHITAKTDAAGATIEITVSPGLARGVADDAPIVVIGQLDGTSPLINEAANYAAQYSDYITIDNVVTTPQIGQGVSFGAETTPYMIIGVDTTAGVKILLNRPLDAGVANDSSAHLMPYGSYSLACIPDAITFVNRPLMPAPQGTGVQAFTVQAGGLSLRVTIGYDQDFMGFKVTIDTLCCVTTLNREMGGLLVA